TLLIITYDEHGGCFDHVPPPTGATPPDNTPGEFGFDFKRFGVRVPCVLVSPLIPAGTVFRVPSNATPLDHTSILKTVENRFGLKSLTNRDKAASDVGAVLTLLQPRKDDPLAGVVVPKSKGPSPHSPSDPPSTLQLHYAALASQLPIPGEKAQVLPALKTSEEADNYIRERTRTWKEAKKRTS